MRSYLVLSSLLVFSDWFLKRNNDPFNGLYSKAILDNLNHGIAAALSWLLVRNWRGAVLSDKLVLIESLISFLIGSLIDLDHFIEARSIYLQDALAPGHKRAFLHCTSLTLVIFAISLIVGLFFHVWWAHIISYIFLTATLSHHLRDALRHGLWICPFGSTRPIPYLIYLVVITLEPIVICNLMDLSGQIVLQKNLFRYHSIPVEEII